VIHAPISLIASGHVCSNAKLSRDDSAQGEPGGTNCPRCLNSRVLVANVPHNRHRTFQRGTLFQLSFLGGGMVVPRCTASLMRWISNLCIGGLQFRSFALSPSSQMAYISAAHPNLRDRLRMHCRRRWRSINHKASAGSSLALSYYLKKPPRARLPVEVDVSYRPSSS